jgi:hypothetical protein
MNFLFNVMRKKKSYGAYLKVACLKALDHNNCKLKENNAPCYFESKPLL